MSSPSLAEARSRLPLRSLMERKDDGPPGGQWRSSGMRCPFCGHKSAGLRVYEGREYFKCFQDTCPSGTHLPRHAWDEVGYLAFRAGLNREEAFKAYLKEAGVWREEMEPGNAKSSYSQSRSADRSMTQPPKQQNQETNRSDAASDGSERTEGSAGSAKDAKGASSVVSSRDGAERENSMPDTAGAIQDTSAGTHLVDEAIERVYRHAPEPHEEPDDEASAALRDFSSQLTLTPADEHLLWVKRGLTPATCRAFGFKSNQPANREILLSLAKKYPIGVLIRAGLWTRNKDRWLEPGEEAKPNPQYCGLGVVGKNENGTPKFDWNQPILIPYFDYIGDGATFELAVVTEGEFKAAALCQAFHGSETVPEPPIEKLIYLRPHKGGVEGKTPRLFLTPSPKGQIGICAIPGITFAKREGGGWGIRTMLEDWLQGAGTRKVVIAYDNEEKGDPKLPGYKPDPAHRHDAQVWARYLARELIKDGHEARVAVLPKVWRDEKGKADWDGALARMINPGHGKPSEIFAASAEKVRAEFYRALKSAVRVEQFVERPYFSKEEEALIYRRLERISYEPKLPLADGAEKIVIKKLSAFIVP